MTEFHICQTEFHICQTEFDVCQTQFHMCQTEFHVCQTVFHVRQTEFHARQTITQIISIIRLLSIDNWNQTNHNAIDNGSLINNIIEMGSGEGKSYILGIVSCILALFKNPMILQQSSQNKNNYLAKKNATIVRNT